MRNINAGLKSADRNVLVLEIDLSKSLGPSKSGKTNLVATTEGNQPVLDKDGNQVVIGLNVYRKK